MEQSMANHWLGRAAYAHGRKRKSRETLTAIKDLRTEITNRQIVQIEAMIVDLTELMKILESDIQLEEKRRRVYDPNHITYPTCAKAMRVRRENLACSVSELEQQLANARSALEEALKPEVTGPI